jgi:hypothetical protein
MCSRSRSALQRIWCENLISLLFAIPPIDKRRRHAAHVEDARAYILHLSEGSGLKTQWQRAAKLLLGEPDAATFGKQFELALFYCAKLVLRGSKERAIQSGHDARMPY